MIDYKRRDTVLAARGIELKNGDYRKKVQYLKKDLHVQKTELQQTIFQPHPVYGFPVSDIKVMNDPDTSAVVRGALEKMNQKLPSNSPYNDDDDVILDTMQYNGESDLDYKDRMQQFIDDGAEELRKQEQQNSSGE